MMSDETQRALITSAATLGGVVIGGVLTPAIQALRERSQTKRSVAAGLRTAKQEALNRAISALYGVELAVHESALSATLSGMMKQNADKASDALLNVMQSRYPNDSDRELVVKSFLSNTEMLKTASNDATTKSIELRQKANEVSMAALSAALAYGLYDGAGALPGRTLATDLHALFAAIPGNVSGSNGALDLWRLLVREFAVDLGALAAWEGRCAASIKAQTTMPETATLGCLPRFEEMVGAVRRTSKLPENEVDAGGPKKA